MKLVTYKINWADEMDISGFRIMTEEAWEELKSELTNFDEEFSYCIGTNQDLVFSSGAKLLEKLKSIDITDSQAEQITNWFGNDYSYPDILDSERLWFIFHEEDEDEY